MLCYDITSWHSFEKVCNTWYQTMRDLCSQVEGLVWGPIP